LKLDGSNSDSEEDNLLDKDSECIKFDDDDDLQFLDMDEPRERHTYDHH